MLCLFTFVLIIIQFNNAEKEWSLQKNYDDPRINLINSALRWQWDLDNNNIKPFNEDEKNKQPQTSDDIIEENRSNGSGDGSSFDRKKDSNSLEPNNSEKEWTLSDDEDFLVDNSIKNKIASFNSENSVAKSKFPDSSDQNTPDFQKNNEHPRKNLINIPVEWHKNVDKVIRNNKIFNENEKNRQSQTFDDIIEENGSGSGDGSSVDRKTNSNFLKPKSSAKEWTLRDDEDFLVDNSIKNKIASFKSGNSVAKSKFPDLSAQNTPHFQKNNKYPRKNRGKVDKNLINVFNTDEKNKQSKAFDNHMIENRSGSENGSYFSRKNSLKPKTEGKNKIEDYKNKNRAAKARFPSFSVKKMLKFNAIPRKRYYYNVE